MTARGVRGEASTEVIWVGALLAAFLTINLLTASLSPTVWMDEVMLADPAINLHLFGRFVSSAWYAQSDNAFWSGYPPLYSLLLWAWLWIAPITPTGIRSLNLFLMTLACLSFWSALTSTRFVKTQAARLVFVMLLLCGFSTSFSYRSGRPDTLGVLLVSVLALLAVSKPSGRRLAGFFCIGMLLPWAGLQLVAYVAILAALATAVTWKIPRVSLVLAGGVVTGAAALGLLYTLQGTLASYFASAQPHTMMAAGQVAPSPLAIIRKMIATNDYSSFDFGTLLLLPAVGLAAWMTLREPRENRPLLLFFLLAAIAVPPILRLLGKYPIYYFWMSFIPMSVLAAFVVDRRDSLGKLATGVAVTLIGSALLLGLPTRIVLAFAEANGRNYEEVSAYVTSALKPDDRAYIDFAAYYPARLRAGQVYLPSYIDVMSAAERRDVNVAVLTGGVDGAADFLAREFGGEWEIAGPVYSPTVQRTLLSKVKQANPYRFVVLRRRPAST